MAQRSYEWTIELSHEHVREIDDALARAKANGVREIVELGPENFSLPTLGPTLEDMLPKFSTVPASRFVGVGAGPDRITILSGYFHRSIGLEVGGAGGGPGRVQQWVGAG